MGVLKHLTEPMGDECNGGDLVLVEHVYNRISGTIHAGLSDHPTLVMPAMHKEELTGKVTICDSEIYITSGICGRCNVYHDSPEMIACKQHGVKVIGHAKDSYRVIRKLSCLEYHWRKFRSLFTRYEDQGFGFWRYVWRPIKTIRL
jgi:hypothetical protein